MSSKFKSSKFKKKVRDALSDTPEHRRRFDALVTSFEL